MKIFPHLHDLWLIFRGKSVTVLAYHSISEGNNPYSVAPKSFEHQMHWLEKHNYTVIGLSSLLSNTFSPGKLTRKTIALTFDDGYKDNYLVAYPILKSLGFKATFLVVTGAVGATSNWDRWQFEHMNWDELGKLYEDGNAIGSHTHSHIRLNETMDSQSIITEIINPKQLIEAKLGSKVIPFAYPYGAGAYSSIVRQRIKEAGYCCAFKSGGFFGNNFTTDPWSLKRKSIDASTGIKAFIATVNGFADVCFLNFVIKELFCMLSRRKK